jgi:NAD(P)-dependent dehydrogenase (short-subunit alcohol dehydrogenase family)
VAPGYVETDFNREFLARPEVQVFMTQRIPVGRTGTPDEVARLVAAIFTERIPYLTGETIYMDGGQGIAH